MKTTYLVYVVTSRTLRETIFWQWFAVVAALLTLRLISDHA